MAPKYGKPNGVDSSKDPSVQLLYAELNRIHQETVSPKVCSVQTSKDRLMVLRNKNRDLYEQFLELAAALAS